MRYDMGHIYWYKFNWICFQDESPKVYGNGVRRHGFIDVMSPTMIYLVGNSCCVTSNTENMLI